MKNKHRESNILILILVVAMSFIGCKTDDPNTNSKITFNPNLTYGSMTDIDGNVYKTIKIGTQIWMAENLKTTKYKDGTSILLVTDNTAWGDPSTPAYCWYNNDASTYKATYGALYNWSAVSTGKLAPTGWHVPTNAEWTTLTMYLNGDDGGKLKETGTLNWTSPNTGATNETGFSALPGGSRVWTGTFNGLGTDGNWWSSSINQGYVGLWYMTNDDSKVGTLGYKGRSGHSVRCVKD
ncbi:MAG: fibrobacter succinogenes major paralogous domain-containing protein [Paludibacter sp.]